MKKLLIIALFLLSILLVSCNTKTPSESVANVSTEDTTSHVHDFSGELKYDELGHFATCECGEVRRSKHIMKTVNVIKEATCIEEGTKETKCKDCEYGKVVTSKISHDYKDEFCTMCGSHKPADGMYFEYSDEYEGWIVKYKDVGDNWDRFLTQLIELYIPTYTDTGEKVVGIGDFSEFEGGRKKVVIPEGIKYILPEAFKNCLSLHEVELPSDPSSAIEIYDRVFFNCRNLEKINLNNSVVYLGEFAFWGCRSLESVVIPSSITKLNYGMFQDCTFLKKVVIPDTVTEMGENVFAYCFYLEELDLGTV